VLGWTLMRGRRLARLIILPTLAIAAYFLLRGDTFGDIRSFLEDLRANGTLMKGRTAYWLALTANEPTLFGNGAGSAALLIEARIGQFQLPHNEYLRVFSDYGTIPLLALIIVLARNAVSKEAHKRLGTLLLAFYMLTGNPLSFPTVIVSYLLIMNSDIIRRGRPVPDGQQAMGAPAPPAPRWTAP
jgi:O-antigen ligase